MHPALVIFKATHVSNALQRVARVASKAGGSAVLKSARSSGLFSVRVPGRREFTITSEKRSAVRADVDNTLRLRTFCPSYLLTYFGLSGHGGESGST